MKELFSLGKLYPSDFLKEGEEPRSEKVELKLMMEDSGLVRLEKVAPKDVMYGKYWYRSGINATMKSELKDIVESIVKVYPLQAGEAWLDIACNDGTLLSYVPKSLLRIGVDPADDTFEKESEQHADKIVQEYFTAKSVGDLKFKVVTSIAMFYDLEEPEKFIKDVYEVLDDNGLWVMQLSYTPLMIDQLAFDNICHEHIYYYSLWNLQNLLSNNGFKIIDCQLNEINGGSMRVYITKNKCKPFVSRPYQDVCDYRTAAILSLEGADIMTYGNIWEDFYNKISSLKERVVDFIKAEKAKGKTVWGYGASTKGNTLLQYFSLDNTLIDGIADRSPAKWGLRTVGTNIKIYSEEEMREAKPDYLLILPWHFINEFKEREKDYLNSGGHFIVPCPTFEII